MKKNLEAYKEDERFYTSEQVAGARDPKYFGRMNDPTSSAYMKGACGDEMEFYLVIKDKIIDDVKYYTDGCISTRICGAVTAGLVLGKTIDIALDTSPGEIISLVNGLPGNHCHCSILAVSTLHKAIADYLLKP